MIIRSADSQGLLLHTPPPMLSGIPTPTYTISYAVQNYQTLERFLELLYFKAKFNLFFLCVALRNGFFFFTTALNEFFLRTLLTVSEETGLEMMVLMCLVT